MKRDMDLVRDILLAVEKETSSFAFEPPEVNGYSKEQIVYHIYIMVQGGLLEAQPTQTQAAVIPMDFSFINLNTARLRKKGSKTKRKVFAVYLREQ